MNEAPIVRLNDRNTMPLVGFGTGNIGGQETMNLVVDVALRSGYRHFDTAKLYRNEPELGNALEKYLPKYGLTREDIFITTKIFPHPKDNQIEIQEGIKESLVNLRTNYLDLVLVHHPKSRARDDDDPLNAINRRDAYQALEQIPKSVVRSIGVSNFVHRHLVELMGYCRRVPAVNQLEFHPHFTRVDIKNFCDEHGIFFQAYASLGRHNPALLSEPLLQELATKYNCSVETVLLSFATSQNIPVLPKSVTPGRIQENLECWKIFLSTEDINRLYALNKNKNYIRSYGWMVR